jgi:2-dehydropantoate 2-reductase
MNILIMAAGAVGGYFGSVLSTSNDVTFVARGEHLRKIQECGLSVKSVTSGNFVFEAPCRPWTSTQSFRW